MNWSQSDITEVKFMPIEWCYKVRVETINWKFEKFNNLEEAESIP